MHLSIIVAFDENRLIGRDNKLPWYLPDDLKHFKALTMGHHMIMGRKTFESIGKPLPGRISVVISRQPDYKAEGCMVVSSLDDALRFCKNQDEVFIIGGAQIFEYAMPLATRLYTTKIHHSFIGDTYFPEISDKEWDVSVKELHSADEKNQWNYSYINYVRKSLGS